jgi:hemerythrin
MAYHEIVWKPDYEIGVKEIDEQHLLCGHSH